jgi:hypothetical protein
MDDAVSDQFGPVIVPDDLCQPAIRIDHEYFSDLSPLNERCLT